MSDPDLKFAILLQNQFDNEPRVINHDDTILATQLQEEFNQEYKTETGMGLSYETNKKTTQHGGKSLVDPSWELVDPTPDIHSLFVVFNERFFWNTLQTVCVSWSKRMTLCAGVCSYQGPGGMCHITLSEPLLKLRPRKDLVETLLHEMIHAFLFVTNNNRDRDGHGPEFHKHMYRINNEAGTNITVYHDFHEEVKLYQQHWWRCNGPCQRYSPYFGMVKRAINRAPGPHDFWWNEHQRKCGGVFTKVREPPKNNPPRQQKLVQTTSSVPNNDITKFVKTSVINNPMHSPNKSPKKSAKPNKPIVSPNRDIRSFFIPITSTGSNVVNKPIQTINNKNGFNVVTTSVFTNGNIYRFKNLGTNNPNKVSKNLNNTDFNNKINKTNKGFVGVKSNNSNTVVVTSKQNSNNSSKPKENNIPGYNVQVFSGTGNVLSTNATIGLIDNYNKVREIWQKKYNNNNDLSNNKRPASDEISPTQNKKHQNTQIVLIDDKPSDLVTCPVCKQKVSSFVIEKHVDECLLKQFKEDKPEEKQETCCVCNKKVPQSTYKEHLTNCFNNSVEDDGLDQLIECPVCESFFDKTIIEKHTMECIEKNSKMDSVKNADKNKKTKDKNKKDDLIKCNVCSVLVESSKYNVHVEKCLHKMLDDIENKYDIPTSNTKVNCLVCKKEILKSELNTHLDECMSDVFNEKIPDENPKEVEEEKNVKPSCSKNHDNVYLYNCPFCMELYSELNMSGHLDECLKSENDNSPVKTILIDSLSSDDF